MRVWALVTVSVLVIALAPWIGSTSLSELSDFIFWQLRFPRVLSGILVGATLGITGAAFQALFGNALATPSTTGTTGTTELHHRHHRVIKYITCNSYKRLIKIV